MLIFEGFHQLYIAIEKEDYERAGRLRDEIERRKAE